MPDVTEVYQMPASPFSARTRARSDGLLISLLGHDKRSGLRSLTVVPDVPFFNFTSDVLHLLCSLSASLGLAYSIYRRY